MASQQRELTPEEMQFNFIVLVICLIGLIVIVLVVWCCCTLENVFHSLDKQDFSVKWNKIRQLYDVDATRPLAIIHANSLLDDALKKRKYSGDTMHKRLVSAQRVFTNKDQVWYANQLRNQLVHDINMTPCPDNDTRRALQGFRQALVDLGALE
jgi:hypothetical protein